MEDTKAKIQRLCSMKNSLMTAAESELAKGIECVNTHEMSAVIDMIKDLFEAEEKAYKACYYKTIVEAMEDEKEEQEMMAKMGMGEGRMGYDHWRYNSGRFAPTGHGHRSGYTDPEQMEHMMGEEMRHMDPWAKMGYSSGGRGGSRFDGGSGSNSMGPNGRMGFMGSERGHRYDRYHQARMGYHESKDATHKEHMDAAGREYVVDMAEALKEVWSDADPAMRKEIKNKFVALLNEMN